VRDIIPGLLPSILHNLFFIFHPVAWGCVAWGIDSFVK
jgi:hypothetical protein